MAENKVTFVIDAVDNASKTLKGIGENVEGVGKKATVSKADVAAAGAGIVASLGYIGTKSIDTFAKFEKTMSGVKAVLNPTAEEFENLTNKARELGKTTTFSAQEAAQGMEMLAKNGLNTTQILNGAADASLNLAAATGADLATAADISTSAMLTFQLGVEGLEQAVNSITGTTNVSKFGINDYALALAQGGGVAKAVGVNFTDFNASIAAISPLFQSGSDAGTSFKTFLLRLVPDSDKAFNAMKDLGIITKEGTNRFFDATGKMKGMAEISGVLQEAFKGLSDEQKNQALKTIFGTDAMRAAAGLAEVGKEKFTELSKAIESTDAGENARIRLDNLSGAFEALSGAVDDVYIALGGTLAPAVGIVAFALGELANGLSFLGQMFGMLPEPVQNFIRIIGGVSLAIVALVAVFAILQVTLGGVGLAMKAIMAEASLFIVPFLAIISVLYLLYEAWNTNFLGIKDITMAVFTAIGDFLKTYVMPIFDELFKTLSFWFEAFFTGIKIVMDVFMVGLQVWLDFFSILWEENFLGIQTIVTGIWTVMFGALEVAWNMFSSIIKAGLQLLRGDWEGAMKTMKIASETQFGLIEGIGKAFWETLGSLFDVSTDEMVGFWVDALIEMEASTKSIWTNIKNFIYDSVAAVVETINAVVRFSNENLGTNMSQLWSMINPETAGRYAHGGLVVPIKYQEPKKFAFGGVVDGPQGLDTVPAMLSAGEIVLNSAMQRNLASNIQGMKQEIQINISGNNFYGDDSTFAERIGNTIMNELKNHVAINTY
jgi:TP901 family phage tail tape measure protein